MTVVIVSSLLVLGGAATVQSAVSPASAATPGTALIDGDTVSGGSSSLEAQAAAAAGMTVTVVSGADWDAMTAEQFATYQVLIAGDPGCGALADSFTSNVSTWAPVVMGVSGGRTVAGNRVVIGTDPVYHYSAGNPGAVTLINDGVAFAGSQPGRTGLYFDATCGGGYGQAGSILSTLSSLSTGAGTWTENDQPPCGGNAAKIASTATFDSLTSGDLAGWNCSVHESFPTFPGDWHPLAIATDTATTPTCGTDVDTGATACGEAYVLIAGSDIVVTSPDLTLSPGISTDPSGGTHTVTATVTRSGAAVAGAAVTFTVTGVNAGVAGTCSALSDCTTDSNGQVSFTYADSNGSGDDTITASFTDAVSGSLESATASEHWTAASQTITVTASDQAITYGDAQPTYTWTTTSTGADTLTTSPTCDVSGTPSAAGSYPISCSGGTAPAGDTIVYEPGTLTIAPAPVVITADDQTTVYGDPDPTYTSTTSGLLGTDTLTTPATCSVTGPHANVGNYPITCTGAGAGANYAISYQPGSLTVTAKPITVTADSFSIVYGQSAPTFTSTTDGLTAGDSLTSPATCTVAGAHTQTGAYPITCAGADAGDNYTISYLPGTFTIASKPGVVTADPKTVVYGSADPTFTYTVSGLQPGDTLAAPPTCAVSGAHTSVGTYPIVCTGGDGAGAYALSYVAGTLTVTKAPVKVGTSSSTIVHRFRKHPFRYRFTTKVVSATTGAPVPGSVVTIRTGGITVCTSTTTVRGVATCTNTHRVHVYWVRRYTATSSTTTNYNSGQAHGVIYAFCTHQTHGSAREHAEVREDCLEGPRGRDHD